eukprot:jgi/Botrbrau1/18274/Bobra.0179s0008.1
MSTEVQSDNQNLWVAKVQMRLHAEALVGWKQLANTSGSLVWQRGVSCSVLNPGATLPRFKRAKGPLTAVLTLPSKATTGLSRHAALPRAPRVSGRPIQARLPQPPYAQPPTRDPGARSPMYQSTAPRGPLHRSLPTRHNIPGRADAASSRLNTGRSSGASLAPHVVAWPSYGHGGVLRADARARAQAPVGESLAPRGEARPRAGEGASPPGQPEGSAPGLSATRPTLPVPEGPSFRRGYSPRPYLAPRVGEEAPAKEPARLRQRSAAEDVVRKARNKLRSGPLDAREAESSRTPGPADAWGSGDPKGRPGRWEPPAGPALGEAPRTRGPPATSGGGPVRSGAHRPRLGAERRPGGPSTEADWEDAKPGASVFDVARRRRALGPEDVVKKTVLDGKIVVTGAVVFRLKPRPPTKSAAQKRRRKEMLDDGSIAVQAVDVAPGLRVMPGRRPPEQTVPWEEAAFGSLPDKAAAGSNLRGLLGAAQALGARPASWETEGSRGTGSRDGLAGGAATDRPEPGLRTMPGGFATEGGTQGENGSGDGPGSFGIGYKLEGTDAVERDESGASAAEEPMQRTRDSERGRRSVYWERQTLEESEGAEIDDEDYASDLEEDGFGIVEVSDSEDDSSAAGSRSHRSPRSLQDMRGRAMTYCKGPTRTARVIAFLGKAAPWEVEDFYREVEEPVEPKAPISRKRGE